GSRRSRWDDHSNRDWIFELTGTGARLSLDATPLTAIRTAAVHTTSVISARNCGRAMPRSRVWVERAGGVKPAPRNRGFVMTPSKSLWPSTHARMMQQDTGAMSFGTWRWR